MCADLVNDPVTSFMSFRHYFLILQFWVDGFLLMGREEIAF